MSVVYLIATHNTAINYKEFIQILQKQGYLCALDMWEGFVKVKTNQ